MPELPLSDEGSAVIGAQSGEVMCFSEPFGLSLENEHRLRKSLARTEACWLRICDEDQDVTAVSSSIARVLFGVMLPPSCVLLQT